MRAGNAGFIKRGRVERGGSPALREMMIKVGDGALQVCEAWRTNEQVGFRHILVFVFVQLTETA